MTKTSGQRQMLVMAILAGLMTIGTFVYLFAAPPGYLHKTSNGVPYFTPPVISPVNGKALDVNRLAQYYKGNEAAGAFVPD
ncbi:MAG TPA: hypothetical protein VMV40_05530 [Acidiferrobacter sp.]|nr:hypothetical protein [Acidiferrobacter sp.]